MTTSAQIDSAFHQVVFCLKALGHIRWRCRFCRYYVNDDLHAAHMHMRDEHRDEFLMAVKVFEQMLS